MKTFFISLLTALHLFQPAVLTSVQEAPPQEQDTTRYNISIDWSQIPDEFDMISYPALGQGEIRLYSSERGGSVSAEALEIVWTEIQE